MATNPSTRGAARGTTLLEAVIALSILLIGLVGMLRLQMASANSDEGGRSHTQALQFGQELLARLQQLDPADGRLTAQYTGTTVPSAFGHLLDSGGVVTSSPFTQWSDGMATTLPGVTTDASLLARTVTDPIDGKVRFQRRWTVFLPTTPLGANGSKLIAVSVTWRERGYTGLREIVLYGNVVNPAYAAALQ
jgi:type IV pilus assembly protein PilV